MAVYAQAPTQQFPDFFGTAVRGFQTGQNMFQAKARLAMEQRRQDAELARVARADERAMELHDLTKRQKEIEIETLHNTQKRQIAQREVVDKQSEELAGELAQMRTQFDTELANLSQSNDPVARRNFIVAKTRALNILQTKYGHVLKDPIYGATYAPELTNMLGGLSAVSGEIEVDQMSRAQSMAMDEVFTNLTTPEGTQQAISHFKKNYGSLALSTNPAIKAQYDATAKELTEARNHFFRRPVSETTAAAKAEREEIKFKQEQEDRTKAKTQERISAATNQKTLQKKRDEIQELRNAIDSSDFRTGRFGTFAEIVWNLGSRDKFGALADEIVSDEWLENVKSLKGALSDKEGARLELAGLSRNDKPEVWLEKLDKIIDQLDTSTKQLKQSGLWYLDAEGEPVSSTDFSTLDEDDDYEVAVENALAQ